MILAMSSALESTANQLQPRAVWHLEGLAAVSSDFPEVPIVHFLKEEVWSGSCL